MNAVSQFFSFSLKALTVAAALVASTQVFASPTCNEPQNTWMDSKVFQENLTKQGYSIKKFKVTSKNCYEIYGTDLKGQRVEIYFNPKTGEPLKTRSDD